MAMVDSGSQEVVIIEQNGLVDFKKAPRYGTKAAESSLRQQRKQTAKVGAKELFRKGFSAVVGATKHGSGPKTIAILNTRIYYGVF